MKLRGLLRKRIEEWIKKRTSRGYGRVKIIPGSQTIIEIPSFNRITDVDVKYQLTQDFAYAHIKWDKERKSLVYELIEPELNEEEKKILEIIKKDLLEIIDVELSEIKKVEGIMDYIEDNVNRILKDEGIKIKEDSYRKIIYYIYRDFVGFNEIDALFHDPYIELSLIHI